MVLEQGRWCNRRGVFDLCLRGSGGGVRGFVSTWLVVVLVGGGRLCSRPGPLDSFRKLETVRCCCVCVCVSFFLVLFFARMSRCCCVCSRRGGFSRRREGRDAVCRSARALVGVRVWVSLIYVDRYGTFWRAAATATVQPAAGQLVAKALAVGIAAF